MYVKALVDFHDNLKNVDRKRGEVFIATEERFAEINSVAPRHGLEAIVERVGEEPKPEQKPEPKRKGRMTKAELAAKAEELGVEVPKGATNAQIAALIEEAEGVE